MTICVRLDDQTARALAEAAAARGQTKSELIRQCVAEFLARQTPQPRAWTLGQDLFGKVGSGRSDRSACRKALVRERVHARKSRR
jgi:hypothetical protein